MAKQAKIGPFSIPSDREGAIVQRGLLNLAALLHCTGRGLAPSTSSLIVALGYLASNNQVAKDIARQLAPYFGVDVDAPIFVDGVDEHERAASLAALGESYEDERIDHDY